MVDDDEDATSRRPLTRKQLCEAVLFWLEAERILSGTAAMHIRNYIAQLEAETASRSRTRRASGARTGRRRW